MRSTQSYSKNIDRVKAALASCDAILIGAGAGLSTAAGFTYAGKRFHENFSDFETKYGFRDMYSGGFYPYETLEEYWAFWSRYVFVNRYTVAPKPVYTELYELVKDTDYFVLTTNVDHCFQKAGFDKRRLFYTQGDYGLFQCSEPCHAETYDNEERIRRMVAEQKDMRISPDLIPYCPKCGKPMTMNLRVDDTFVQDGGWKGACKRYENFATKHKADRLLLFEFGVGSNTPVIVKYPFWRMTAQNKNATYVCVNYGEAFCPQEIASRSVCVNEDIADFLSFFAPKA